LHVFMQINGVCRLCVETCCFMNYRILLFQALAASDGCVCCETKYKINLCGCGGCVCLTGDRTVYTVPSTALTSTQQWDDHDVSTGLLP